MFVRFRKSRAGLQVSLIETSRVDGKVRQEHVATLGTVKAPPSVADRAEFWRRLHERIGQLSNRVDQAAIGKLLGEVHARIPMVTADELRELQLKNTEADERFWTRLRDLQQEQVDGNKELLAIVQKKIALAEAQLKHASEGAEAAKDRAQRLRNGEAVAGGTKALSEEEINRILSEAGWTTKDREHARIVHELSELGGFEELIEETNKRHRRADFAAARAVLRRRQLVARAR